MNLLFGLIASSVVGSVIFLTLLLLRPITGKIFSKSWHYYCLIVPLVFLLGGTHIAVSLTRLISYYATADSSQILTSHEIPVNIPQGFIIPPMFDNMSDMPVNGGETDIALASSSPITGQLILYFEKVTPFLLAIWLLGAILFMVISTRKYLKYRNMVLYSTKSVATIDCKIPIAVSMNAHTPMLIGVIKPIIILPNMYFTDEEIAMILAHEMVHYRRKDLFVKLLMLISNAVHWFNPVVYVLNRQLNLMCELSCDEKIVSNMDTQSRRFYGETILQVLQHSTTKRNLGGNVAFATNLCNSKRNFRRRLTSMMNTKKMSKFVVILALASGLLVVAGGFAISSLVGSAMPSISVYANEAVQNDYEIDVEAQSHAPDAYDSQENIAVQDQFQWPLDGYTRVTAPFGMMTNPIAGIEEFHRGIDIPAPEGTPILAAKDGYIISVAIIVDSWFGKAIVIDHGGDYHTLYAHASAIHVEEGQFVRQGEHIADVGATGMASGSHLHFEIRINSHSVDPLPFLSAETEGQRIWSEWAREAREDIEVTHSEVVPTEISTVDSTVYVIEHAERNISFALVHRCFGENYPMSQPYHISFEEAAIIMADAIYQRFGICIDGMDGDMFFVERMNDDSWAGNIYSEKFTEHAPDNNLFHFVIDAITGNVLTLYMNTEESPFR